ncbi:MAG TPA: hypothetical protein VHX66_11965 [Solirubrobacteraceae bacterium]|jgi:hypothetical protein|nr:hypothetical protein [Solirubrobacteraceae bacterium]
MVVWYLDRVLSGLWRALVIAAGVIAGVATGTFPLLPSLGVLVLCFLWFAWDWQRLKEYNREDRY